MNLQSAKRRIRDLERFILSMEWVQPMYNGCGSCPCCGNMDHWGHAKDCTIAKLKTKRCNGDEWPK